MTGIWAALTRPIRARVAARRHRVDADIERFLYALRRGWINEAAEAEIDRLARLRDSGGQPAILADDATIGDPVRREAAIRRRFRKEGS